MKTTSKTPVALSAAALVLAVSSVAQAQSLGAQGDFTLGVERVFGMYISHIDQERMNVNLDRDPTSIGLAYQRPNSMLTIPRVGFDYFIIPQLSLGGTLGFYSDDPDDTDGDPGDNNDESSGLLFAPRVGYAIDFNAKWGVWLRGGLTYVSVDRDNDDDVSLIALSGEGAFYFMPVPSVGFTLSPLFDLGLSGEEHVGNDEWDYNERVFGISLGMFGRF
jgi:hypothetical protein